MNAKDRILDKLSAMPPEMLDRKRDEKLLELRNILQKLYKAKDEELVTRHKKRKELLEENSASKTEILLRQDEELYQLKRIIMELGSLRKKIELELEILKSMYWKARS